MVVDAPDPHFGKPKLMRFLPDGTFIGRQEVEPQGRMNLAHTNPAFSNGLRVQSNGLLIVDLGDARTVRSGESRGYHGSAVFDPESSRQDTIGWFPGLIHLWSKRRDKPTRIRQFSPETHINFGPAAIFIGDSKSYEIGRYTLAGKLEKVIRRSVPPERVRGEDVDRLVDYVSKVTRQRSPNDPNAVAEAIERARTAPRVKWKPVFGDVRGDTEGNLWVRDHDNATVWSVFDSAGLYLGDVRTPEGERLYRIERDVIFTEVPDEDDFGLQRFRLYRLLKPA